MLSARVRDDSQFGYSAFFFPRSETQSNNIKCHFVNSNLSCVGFQTMVDQTNLPDKCACINIYDYYYYYGPANSATVHLTVNDSRRCSFFFLLLFRFCVLFLLMSFCPRICRLLSPAKASVIVVVKMSMQIQERVLSNATTKRDTKMMERKKTQQNHLCPEQCASILIYIICICRISLVGTKRPSIVNNTKKKCRNYC